MELVQLKQLSLVLFPACFPSVYAFSYSLTLLQHFRTSLWIQSPIWPLSLLKYTSSCVHLCLTTKPFHWDLVHCGTLVKKLPLVVESVPHNCLFRLLVSMVGQSHFHVREDVLMPLSSKDLLHVLRYSHPVNHHSCPNCVPHRWLSISWLLPSCQPSSVSFLPKLCPS